MGEPSSTDEELRIAPEQARIIGEDAGRIPAVSETPPRPG